MRPTVIEADFIFSLGPNCRNAWNLRNYFGTERAYPFDWWITPAKSMLRMIEPGFQFHVVREDLHITQPVGNNTVYNYNLNLLHHHDFPRDWRGTGRVLSTSDEDIAKLNAKYVYLFERLHADLRSASRPVAVLNESYAGWKREHQGVRVNPDLNGAVAPDVLAREIRARLGQKVRVLFIAVGETKSEDHEWGWSIQLPDLGDRELIKGAEFAEPIHTFRQAYAQLDIRLIPEVGAVPA